MINSSDPNSNGVNVNEIFGLLPPRECRFDGTAPFANAVPVDVIRVIRRAHPAAATVSSTPKSAAISDFVALVNRYYDS